HIGSPDDQVLRTPGRGAVLVTAHFGNWAAMGQAVTRLGVPLTLLMYEGVAPALREQLQRAEAGRAFAVLPTDGSAGTAAAALDLLRRGEAVGMMGDRGFAGRTATVPFLGGDVAFPVGPYVLAATAGARLAVAFLVRTGAQRYTLHAVPIDVPPLSTRRERAAALQQLAAAFARTLAACVREHPLQWGNFHDLWAAEAGR
ncbi:MAG: lysophospholipid acyltransferase family protein, partial [Planctomycetes bacterium]|nr:lysophospholipid acyltransferase family protein [Planctomycetota bacterium]